VVLLLIFVFVEFNGFIKLNNKVKEAFATMDIYLKKRWDLIPNLVETVKG
jgi:LemA protein